MVLIVSHQKKLAEMRVLRQKSEVSISAAFFCMFLFYFLISRRTPCPDAKNVPSLCVPPKTHQSAIPTPVLTQQDTETMPWSTHVSIYVVRNERLLHPPIQSKVKSVYFLFFLATAVLPCL